MTRAETSLAHYLQYVQEAEQTLAVYGGSGAERNQGVTMHYHTIAEQDPLFMWCSAATIGSVQVGLVL